MRQTDRYGRVVSSRRWSPKTFNRQQAVNLIKSIGTIKQGATAYVVLGRNNKDSVRETQTHMDLKYVPKGMVRNSRRANRMSEPKTQIKFSVEASVSYKGHRTTARSQFTTSRDLEMKKQEATENLLMLLSDYDDNQARLIFQSVHDKIRYKIVYYS